MIKPKSSNRLVLESKVESLMGLPVSETLPTTVNGDDLNLHLGKKNPSGAWNSVNSENIGEGFEAVDLSVFDRVGDSNRTLFVKPFKNKFITGRSDFLTYTCKVKLTSKKKSKRQTAINESSKVTRDERKKFSVALGTHIDTWRNLFVNELLPMTLAIGTASEEVKDRMSQLVDDSIGLPTDYIKIKALQAVQIKVVRTISESLGLTAEETRLLHPELLSKGPPK